MNTVARLTIFAVLLIGFIACDFSEQKVKSEGAAYELFVVCTPDIWEGSVGDTLREIVLEPVAMINQQEPRFDLFFVQPMAFTGLVVKHKNILKIESRPEFKTSSIVAEYNVYAAPQIVINVTGPDNASIATYLSEHASELQTVLEITERDRYLASSKKYNEKSLEGVVEKMFGMKISIPKGYTLRNEKNNFLWLSYEYPQASQGIVIYSYPYIGKDNFTIDSLLSARNKYTALIPGPSDNSFMTTGDQIEPTLSHKRINGRYWAELRGFWDVKDDFMGGPFVSYSTVDLANHRVVTIDMYLFSPKLHKRNFLRQLEAEIYSVSFPEDTAKESEATQERE